MILANKRHTYDLYGTEDDSSRASNQQGFPFPNAFGEHFSSSFKFRNPVEVFAEFFHNSPFDLFGQLSADDFSPDEHAPNNNCGTVLPPQFPVFPHFAGSPINPFGGMLFGYTNPQPYTEPIFDRGLSTVISEEFSCTDIWSPNDSENCELNVKQTATSTNYAQGKMLETTK